VSRPNIDLDVVVVRACCVCDMQSDWEGLGGCVRVFRRKCEGFKGMGREPCAGGRLGRHRGWCVVEEGVILEDLVVQVVIVGAGWTRSVGWLIRGFAERVCYDLSHRLEGVAGLYSGQGVRGGSPACS
jgi:hypothetical protein